MTKELKKVSFEDYRKELDRVREKLRQEIGGLDVQIQEISYTSNVVDLGVNWSALGTVNTEEAVNFTKHIQKAVELVNNFKYIGMEII